MQIREINRKEHTPRMMTKNNLVKTIIGFSKFSSIIFPPFKNLFKNMDIGNKKHSF